MLGNLRRRRGGHGASFAVAEGSITALIGPNGAGKTTMFNLVSGFLRRRGTVRFAGERIDRWRADAIARAGLVRAFQAARVLTRMPVLDNMLLAAQRQPGERLVTALLAPGRVARREREVRARAGSSSSSCASPTSPAPMPARCPAASGSSSSSGGRLMVEPRMILLDEPMAGVAPVLGSSSSTTSASCASDRGVTVLVIEHDMDVVMSISDRVIVMDEGHVIAEGPPEAIQRDERVIEAYLGRLGAIGRRGRRRERPVLAARDISPATAGRTSSTTVVDRGAARRDRRGDRPERLGQIDARSRRSTASCRRGGARRRFTRRPVSRSS